MPVNVVVFHVDCGSEGLQRVIVKTVQRRHQLQVFRNALRDGLSERMVLYREGNVRAQQFQRIQFTVFVEGIARSATQGNHSGEASAGLERRQALEEFRGDVPVGAQKN